MPLVDFHSAIMVVFVNLILIYSCFGETVCLSPYSAIVRSLLLLKEVFTRLVWL